MTKTRIKFKLVLAIAILSCSILFANVGKAGATHIPFPWFAMPGYLAPTFPACGHTFQSPCFWPWLSAAGQPTVVDLTVPYGTASIPLDLNLYGIVSIANTNGAYDSRQMVMSATGIPTANFGGLVGSVRQLYWPPNSHQVVGNAQSARTTFTYSPTGGFTTSGVYTVIVDARTINRFLPGQYGCVAGGPGDATNFNFANCPYQPLNLQININVTQPDGGNCALGSGTITVYPSETFQVPVVANNTGGVDWSVAPANPARHLLVRDGGSTAFGGPTQSNIDGPGVTPTGFGPVLFRGRSTNWTLTTFTAPPTTGTHTLSWRIFHGGAGFVGASCTVAVHVVERPYYRTYGGDISVGAGQQPACRIDGNASLLGINRTPSSGAGTQLAIFALGLIMDTATAQVRTNGATPRALSFANSSPVAPFGDPWGAANYNNFGGGGLDDGNAVCAADFWEGATAIRPNGYTITPAESNVAMGVRRTIYVNGDAYINNNINYANGNYSLIDQIPSFRLIARGNIYVAPGVTELNGLFVAIARDQAAPTDGRFYTCWPGNIPTAADINGVCRANRLTVHGAVIAELIKLTRSNGSAHTSTSGERYDNALGTAAEKFIYSPEVWLTSDLTSGTGEVDSLVTLPPVL